MPGSAGYHELTVYDDVTRLGATLDRAPLRASVNGRILSADPSLLDATADARATMQVSTGDSGFDVAFDRVIDQPGRPERREHYTWHYPMLPNQFVIGADSTR